MKISDKFHLEDVYRLKNTVLTGKTEDIKWRIHHINIISKLLDENKKEIIKSLFVDLGKSEIEGLSEILLVKQEISLIKKKLNSWMRPKKIDTSSIPGENPSNLAQFVTSGISFIDINLIEKFSLIEIY